MRTPATVGMTGLTGLVLLLSWHSSQQSDPLRHRASAAVAGLVSPALSLPPAVARTAAPVLPRRTPSPVRRTAAPAVHPSSAPVVRATPSAAPKPTRSAAPVARDVVVNGASVDTRYGPVQVQVTIRSGRITKADAIDYPQGSGRDQEINSYAVPQLNGETVRAQSARIDTVSGATYTSDGYRASLQSALDAAHRAGAL